jgi:hypothetical protein
MAAMATIEIANGHHTTLKGGWDGGKAIESGEIFACGHIGLDRFVALF